MPSRATEVQSLRYSAPEDLNTHQIAAAVQDIVAKEGFKPQMTAQRVDTASQHLPVMDLDGLKDVKAKMSKVDKEGPLTVEGGFAGLVDRADRNNDNRVSRDEIVQRLKSEKLSDNEVRALKGMYRNFGDIDLNHNGNINVSELNSFENRSRDWQRTAERLAALEAIVATRRATLDHNKDGVISEGELGRASGNARQFNSKERQILNWAHDRWAQSD